MNNLIGKILTVLLLSSLGLVASCHSDSGGNYVPIPAAPIPAADPQFRVGLVALDVRRVSSGDTVAVNPAGITSEEMTLDQ